MDRESTFGTRALPTLAALLVLSALHGRASEPLSGHVTVDGSSTVSPIMVAAAELFQAQQPRVRVTVGVSGTGGGFKKFLESRADLRTHISNASRPIKPAEIEKAASVGVEFIELPIALDGIAVVTPIGNSFCDALTVAELKRIWAPGSDIRNWSQIRPGFPDVPLKLYGPGTDSGTFDYFTEVVVGAEKSCRSDYTASENDNVLVQGVSGDAGALGYFGFSYYEANKAKLKLLAIDGGDGAPVKPSLETIRQGTYRPLARPLFLYVNLSAVKRAEVRAFLDFVLSNAQTIVEHPRVNYVALPEELYGLAKSRLDQGRTGSAMASAPAGGALNLIQLFRNH